MTANRLLILAIVFAVTSVAACDDEHDALPPGDDLIAFAVALARVDHGEVDRAPIDAEIDRLAAAWRGLAEGKDAVGRADAFARLLFDVEEFVSVSELTDADNLHLGRVLERRRGYCLSLSLVALAVARRVGEPLFGVAAPNHFFVRYDDGETRRSLELTRRGRPLTREDELSLVGELYDDESLYLDKLDDEQVAAMLLHNRGYVAMHDGRHDQAERDFRAVIERLPELPEAHRNLGVVLGERGEYGAAEAAFLRALELYPGDVDALINLAICRHAEGDVEAALDDLRLAVALDPNRPRAAELLAEWSRGHRPIDERDLVPGLRARYYRDRSFQSVAVERVDRDVDFDWQNSAPARGVPRDGFAVRWEGYLRAPRAGDYTLFIVSNDGVRVDLGGRRVIDHWRNMGYENWYGFQDVTLDEGLHEIVIEYYDHRGGARILCRLGEDGEEKPLDLRDLLFHRR